MMFMCLLDGILSAKRINNLEPCRKWGECPRRATEQKVRRSRDQIIDTYKDMCMPCGVTHHLTQTCRARLVLQTRVMVLLGAHKGPRGSSC